MPINLLVILLLIVGVSGVFTESLAASVFQLLLALITIWLVRRRPEAELRLYLLVLVVALCFMFAVHHANIAAYDAPYYKGGSDDLLFEQNALQVKESGNYSPSSLVGTVLDRYHNAPFYVVLVSGLMNFGDWFDGYSTFLPKVLNVYLLLWLIIGIGDLLRKYAKFSDRQIYWFITLFGITPNILLINSHVFRDMFNMLQIVLIVMAFDRLLSRRWGAIQFVWLAALPVLLYTTFYTRANALVFAAIVVLFMLATKLRIRYRYMLLLGVPIVLFTTLVEDIRFQYFYEKYTEYQTALSSGLSNFIFEQPLFPLGIFLRFGYAFITPFPNFLGLFKNPDMLQLDVIYFLVFLFVVVQILSIPFILKRMLTIDWLTLSFLFCLFGVVLTTFTFRHVVFYYPFLVAMAIDGYSRIRPTTAFFMLMLTVTGLVGMFFLYIQLKV